MTATHLRALLVLVLTLAAVHVSAATHPGASGRIVGTVSDAVSGETLIGANVLVLGTSLGAATDIDGHFSIPSVPSGPQRLRVSYIGYAADTLDVVVPDGGSVEVNVTLQSATFEGVTVTAQVAGQLAAINEQYGSRTVVNIVSADRIQELPDNNAAESIGRLPGVAIQRSGGEANTVSIRGLSPEFNNVTVNGVRLAGTDGGNRSVDLSLVSSNILDGIEVRKAITPDMDADAVGGTINLRLKNAPSSPSLDLLAQGGYTGLQGYLGNYKFVGTASNRFFQDRFGAIATFNVEQYDRSADKLSVGYGLGSLTDGSGESALYVNNISTREETVRRSRTGGSLLLDYTLPGGRASANAFYNSRNDDARFRYQNVADRLAYNLERQNNETALFSSAIGVEQDFGWVQYDATATLSISRAKSPENFTWVFNKEGTGFGQGTEARYGVLPQDVLILADSTTELSQLWVDDSRLDEDQTGFQLNLQSPFRVGEWVTGYIKTRWEASLARPNLRYEPVRPPGAPVSRRRPLRMPGPGGP